jgi:hypothetical protein
MRVTAFTRGGDVHERLGVAYRKGSEQQQIDEAKDPRAGTDTEGERDDGGGGEPGRAAHRARRVAKIAGQIVHQ